MSKKYTAPTMTINEVRLFIAYYIQGKKGYWCPDGYKAIVQKFMRDYPEYSEGLMSTPECFNAFERMINVTVPKRYKKIHGC